MDYALFLWTSFVIYIELALKRTSREIRTFWPLIIKRLHASFFFHSSVLTGNLIS